MKAAGHIIPLPFLYNMSVFVKVSIRRTAVPLDRHFVI